MPLAVFSLCVLGTWVLAQPPGFPRNQPPGAPGAPGGRQPGFGSPPRTPNDQQRQPGGIGALPGGPGAPGGIGQPTFPGSPQRNPGGPPSGFGSPNIPENPGAEAPMVNPPDIRGRMPQAPPGFGAAPNIPEPNFPEMVMQSQGTCSKCNKIVTWTGNTAPTSCPHCGTKFGYVENADGTKTYTSSGKAGNIAKIVVWVIVGLSLLGAVIAGIVRAASGGGAKKKVKKRKKVSRKPRLDDDDY